MSLESSLRREFSRVRALAEKAIEDGREERFDILHPISFVSVSKFYHKSGPGETRGPGWGWEVTVETPDSSSKSSQWSPQDCAFRLSSAHLLLEEWEAVGPVEMTKMIHTVLMMARKVGITKDDMGHAWDESIASEVMLG